MHIETCCRFNFSRHMYSAINKYSIVSKIIVEKLRQPNIVQNFQMRLADTTTIFNPISRNSKCEPGTSKQRRPISGYKKRTHQFRGSHQIQRSHCRALTLFLLAHYDINNQEIENDEELKIKVKLYNDQEIENDVELIKVKLFKDVLLKLRRNNVNALQCDRCKVWLWF